MEMLARQATGSTSTPRVFQQSCSTTCGKSLALASFMLFCLRMHKARLLKQNTNNIEFDILCKVPNFRL